MLLKLTEESEFNEVVKNGVVLVDFFATWCGPCKMLLPELEELSAERDDVNIVEIDIDVFPELAAKFNVRAVPTLILFKDGENKKTTTGFLPKNSLIKFID